MFFHSLSTVLRSLGLKKAHIVTVYVIESLAILLSAFCLGLCIGTVVASTLTLQFNLFTEMPFGLQFPTALFTSMLLLCIAVGIVASSRPATNLLKSDIARILVGRAAL